MHAYERHAYEMAPVRGTPMRWPMKDARLWETRLWDGLCEKHAYERRAYEMAAYERHPYGMVYWRCTSIKYPSIGDVFNESVQITFTIWNSQMASLLVRYRFHLRVFLRIIIVEKGF